MTTTGIVLFDGVEELDFVGPWEVLSAARIDDDRVVTVAERPETIACNKGLRVIPDCTFAECPDLDVVVIPGGRGTRREVDNPVVLAWVAEQAAQVRWVTSVCTGSFLLGRAGVLDGRRATTHWACMDELRRHAPAATVVDHERYVVDGNVVTAAGVSAGIDMALWLTIQLYGEEHARQTQRFIEYFPQPPLSTDPTWRAGRGTA